MLKDVQAYLANQPAEKPIVFVTGAGDIGPGYHITELKSADTTSIDCGGNLRSFREVTVQLLDGNGGDYMNVGRVSGILGKSLDAIPELARTIPRIEFAPKNDGLRLYEIGVPAVEDTRIVIPLTESGAECKAMQPGAIAKAASGCCD